MYTPKRINVHRGSNHFSPFAGLPFSAPNMMERDELQRKSRGTKVIEKGDLHKLMTYGIELPVEVASAIATNEEVTSVIDNSGWAILINHPQLLVWRYTATAIKKITQCLVLPLGYTELHHRPALVCITQADIDQPTYITTRKTGVVCVSPEGVVRWWLNVTRSSNYAESALPLNGKICHMIISAMPHGIILVTTTSEMYLLNMSNSSITCQQVHQPSGMFSGLGRRMSSLWSQPDTPKNMSPCLCNGTVNTADEDRSFFMISKGTLQKWHVTDVTNCKLIFESDILTCFKSYVAANENVNHLRTVASLNIVDIKYTGYAIVTLLSVELDAREHLLLGTIKVSEARLNFESLISLGIDKNELVGAISLTVTATDYQAFVTSSRRILSHSLSKNSRNLIDIPFTGSSRVITSGVFHGDAIFLTKQHGMLKLSITTVNMFLHDQPSSLQQVDETDALREEETLATKDMSVYAALKNTLIAFTRGNMLTADIVASIEGSSGDFHDALIKLSAELLNSPPVSDPRWAGHSVSGFATSSVLIQNQLRDKEQIHNNLVDFVLKSTLSKMTDDHSESVKRMLMEHGEKIECINTLFDMFPHYSDFISEVIDICQENYSEKMPSKEAFFANITNVDNFFIHLAKVEAEKLLQLKTVISQVELISVVSGIIATCFTSAWRFRQNNQHRFQFTREYIPWTGSSDGVNNRSLVHQQIEIALEQGLPNVDSTKVGSVLIQHIVLLSDILLDAMEKEIALSVVTESPVNEEFRNERRNIILSLINRGYYEQASTLAEKYEDFIMLILLCEKTSDNQRLQQYKVTFAQQGFENELYKWYLDKGCWDKLMSTREKSSELDRFLSSRKQLSWIYHLGMQRYDKAGEVLKELAHVESQYASRRKMLLVLSNLTTMAIENDNQSVKEKHIQETDEMLELLQFQEHVMKVFDENPSSAPPYTADQLITKMTNDDLTYLCQEDFYVLMDLLQYASDPVNFSKNVWTKCVLQDKWSADDVQFDHGTLVSHKMFYKCLKYCSENQLRQSFIPPLKDLLSFVRTETIFKELRCQHQLQACYELLDLNHLIG